MYQEKCKSHMYIKKIQISTYQRVVCLMRSLNGGVNSWPSCCAATESVHGPENGKTLVSLLQCHYIKQLSIFLFLISLVDAVKCHLGRDIGVVLLNLIRSPKTRCAAAQSCTQRGLLSHPEKERLLLTL